MFPGENVHVLQCGDTSAAKRKLDEGFATQPTDIVLHTGTNDIETVDACTVAEQIMTNAAEAAEGYGCNVVVSTLPPRSDQPNDMNVEEANKRINQLKQTNIRYSRIKVVNHNSLTVEHLYDRKHLSSFRKHGVSGCQVLAGDFYWAVYGKELQETRYNSVIKQRPYFRQRMHSGPNY